MEITIESVDDDTPKGLTTGFCLKLNCKTPEGQSFQLDVPLLVGKEVMAKQVPLLNLAVGYLEHEGLAAYPDLFVDSRQANMDKVDAPEFELPRTLSLGGPEILNKKILEQIAK